MKQIDAEKIKAYIPGLDIGDRVLLSGTIYTARDAAHKRIFELLDRGEPLPIPLKNGVIYYASPTPAPKAEAEAEGAPSPAVGACGPTTSGRMDPFTPRLLDLGLACMIGKGERNQAVIDAIVRNQAIYLCAIGGAGALMSRHIVSAVEIAFPELGCESVKGLVVKDMPLTVAIDMNGNSIFEQGRQKYRKQL